MKANKITACYLGPHISPEQFVSEHFFLFLVAGKMQGYDGHRNSTLRSGESCLVRKNYLVRYNKQKENDRFEKVVVIFDEIFLKEYGKKYHISNSKSESGEALFPLRKTKPVESFLKTLSPLFKNKETLTDSLADLKRDELLSILLKENPEIRDIFFDFGIPEKIDIQSFMNRNYKFKVTLSRFAYLTGRSLTSFKKDFEQVFHSTPGRWLIQKRLKEAHFLMDKEGWSASDVYLEVGFEDLSHFSYAFKKFFGFPPTRLRFSASPKMVDR